MKEKETKVSASVQKEVLETDKDSVENKKDEVYTEAFLKLLDKVSKLEEGVNKPIVENTKDTPNEVLDIPAQPRNVVFQIKGLILDDAIKEGSYIPGKAYGISKNKLVCELVNLNPEIETRVPELDKWKTGFEIDDILYSDLPEEVKNQRIKEIKTARAWIEYRLRTSLSDTNASFWNRRKLEISDLGKIYDTSKDIENLVLYYNILGGGYPEIAPSYEAAKISGKKLYLTVYEDEAKRQVTKDRVIWKAYAKLDELDESWSLDDCLYLLYALDNKKEHGFTLSTPKDLILKHLKSFIDGENEDDKKKKPKEFLDITTMMRTDPQYVKMKATFNAAVYFGYIVSDKDRTYKNKQTGFVYGSSDRAAIEKLLDPKNIDEFSYINSKIRDKFLK
jgi:hypothetical protein